MINYVLQKGLLFFASLLLFLNSFSQERTITGTITDDKGTPLTGATVSVKNTKVSTSTNTNGAFNLRVPSNARTLVVSYVGMQLSEVAIGNGNAINVALNPTADALTDVVVVGYGRSRRANLTTAQTSVGAKEIERTVNTTVEQALQGRAAGVYVTQSSY